MDVMKNYVTVLYLEQLHGALDDMASDRAEELERDFPGFLRVAEAYRCHLEDYSGIQAYELACDIIDFLHDYDPYGFECDGPEDARELETEIRETIPHNLINDLYKISNEDGLDEITLITVKNLINRLYEVTGR